MLKYLKGSHSRDDIRLLRNTISNAQDDVAQNCTGYCIHCDRKKVCQDLENLVEYLDGLLN